MRWNFFAGTAIVPTLARLVLAMAFIATGLHKISGKAEYTAEEAATLKTEFGVNLDESPVVKSVSWIHPAEQVDPNDEGKGVTDPPVQSQSESDDPSQQRDPADVPPGSTGEPDVDDPPATPPLIDQPGAQPVESQPPAGTEAEPDDADIQKEPVIIEIPPASEDAAPSVSPGASYRGLALHKITLLLHNNNIPNGNILAWIAALTEFIGGVLLLVGLFSRVWGLGLAITMAMAFYMTSMHAYFVEVGPLEAGAGADGHALFNRVFCQLGLGALALTVFLVGPGPLSLDRLIFRPKREEIEVVEVKG